MFELAYPWVLLALILPIIIRLFFRPLSASGSAALIVPFYKSLYPVIVNKKNNVLTHKSSNLFFIVWTLVVLALSNPRWVGEPLPAAYDGHNIMLALDISASMKLTDMLVNGQYISRLNVVKRTAVDFVQKRTGDKIGLILFGSVAYLQTPLTYDHQNIITRIDDASIGLAGQATAIGDAIGLAVKRLQQVSDKSRIIILLTDGVNNSGILTPQKAAELANSEHIRIYTIGLGLGDDPHGLTSFFSNAADLDEESLKIVANLTGGKYFRAMDMKSLEDIYQTIHRLETIRQKGQSLRPQKEYYCWPLAMSFILLMYWFFQQTNRNRSITRLI
ncbi:MAG: VWA domain-containing protein [Legionella sp.]